MSQLKNVVKNVVLAIIFGALTGALTALVISSQPRSTNELVRDFYLTENAVHVSPHSLRVKMDKGAEDFVLVDLRSAEEYAEEHVVGAVNIPAYSDPNTLAYQEVDRIVDAFVKLPKDKDIIVYCYSIPCMTGRKIGKMLAERGIYVKHLGIGWNEWRHYWTLWNHEGEWNATQAEDYVALGVEPGVPKRKTNSTACPVGNKFSC